MHLAPTSSFLLLSLLLLLAMAAAAPLPAPQPAAAVGLAPFTTRECAGVVRFGTAIWGGVVVSGRWAVGGRE